MTDPARVRGFLELFGAWDPTLAFVMGGAVAVAAPAFWWVQRHRRTLLAEPAQLPGEQAAVGGRRYPGAAGTGDPLVELVPVGLGVEGRVAELHDDLLLVVGRVWEVRSRSGRCRR